MVKALKFDEKLTKKTIFLILRKIKPRSLSKK